MNPLRTMTLNGHVVEEYVFNRTRSVYLDDRLFWGTYEDAVAEIQHA